MLYTSNNMWVKNKHQISGFTIVELLIVVVVIAILAAITIVSYNGITSRANTSAAQSAANTVMKKSEAFNSFISKYPVYPVDFSAAQATGTVAEAQLTGSRITLAAVDAKPANPATVEFKLCENQTGAAIAYWNYSTNAKVVSYLGTCTEAQYKDTAFVGGPY